MLKEPFVVSIIGTTASGKSNIALQVARYFGGEIVCIDSRTIYEGMNIGTAKPTNEEQKVCPHHLINITKVDSTIRSLQLREKARASIIDIIMRGKLPILVGGATLLGELVLNDFEYEIDKPEGRKPFDSFTLEELKQALNKQGIPLPFDRNSRRSLISYLEAYGKLRRQIPKFRALRIGVSRSREDLISKIVSRARLMMEQGLEGEVESLVKEYGWGYVLSTSIGYQEFRQYFEGRADKSSILQRIISNTIAYADYQSAWFEQYRDTIWVKDAKKTIEIVRRAIE